MIFFFLFICSCTQQISGVKEPHQRWCSPSWGSSRVKDSSRQSCKNDREGSRIHALIRWFEFKQVYLLREDVRVSIASRFTQLTYLFTIQMSLLSHFKVSHDLFKKVGFDKIPLSLLQASVLLLELIQLNMNLLRDSYETWKGLL